MSGFKSDPRQTDGLRDTLPPGARREFDEAREVFRAYRQAVIATLATADFAFANALDLIEGTDPALRPEVVKIWANGVKSALLPGIAGMRAIPAASRKPPIDGTVRFIDRSELQ